MNRNSSSFTRPRAVGLIAITVMSLFTGCTSQKPRKDIGRLATEYIRALDTRAGRGDLDRFLAKWADDPELTVSHATMRTKGEIGEFFQRWAEMFTQWKHVEVRRLVQGNTVAWEGIARGIHRSTGKLLSLPMVIIMEFDQEGKVMSAHVYFDTGVLQEQLLATRIPHHPPAAAP